MIIDNGEYTENRENKNYKFDKDSSEADGSLLFIE